MIKKGKLVFDNIKDSPIASIMSASIMLVSLLIAFVFSRSIKSIMNEIGFFSTKLLFVLYCVVIAFGVFNVIFSYIYLFKKLEKRLYVYRVIGATKLDIITIQLFEVIIKYNIVYAIAVIISEYLFGLAEGEFFPSLTIIENVVIYLVMLVLIVILVIMTLIKILFAKNTISNKEFL